MEELLFHN